MNQQVVNVEHKSTSAEIGAGSPYWKRLIIDSQISVYQTGVRALGFEPVGTLYDVVKKVRLMPQLATPVENREYTKPKDRACKECKKKAPAPLPHVELVDEREVSCVDGRIVTDPGGRLYANLRDRDETLDEFRMRVRADIGTTPEKYFQRGVVLRLQQEEIDAAADSWELGRQIRESQLENRWPRNPEACEAYGSFCPYWDVCTGAASIDDPTRYRAVPSSMSAPDDGKKRLPILSVSAMKTYRSCQRKYLYAYEQRKRAVTDVIALRFGSVFHVGLEVWWTTVNIAQATAAMRASYLKHEIDPIDAIKAEELLLGYHVRWQNEPLHVLAVEAEFVAPLMNPKTGAPSKTWELGGKIDAIVRAPEAASAAA
jgi:hypothetical protein